MSIINCKLEFTMWDMDALFRTPLLFKPELPSKFLRLEPPIL